MRDKDTWEDEVEIEPEDEDWPFDEDDEFIIDEILEDWDKIDEVDDFKYYDQ